jgi:protoheme ferro-lyase
VNLVEARPGWSGDRVALVLAAHGTLLAPSRPIDTGLAATEALATAIRARLTDRFGLIVNGWLNHTRGGKWTEPAMNDALKQVVDAGYRRAVYFPYGFLADNAETELEGRIFLRQQPALEALHLPCLNALAAAVVAETRASGALSRAS